MANHEIPCTNCERPCESIYNEDGECWGPIYPEQTGLDWEAYIKLYYRERGDVPPSERTDES